MNLAARILVMAGFATAAAVGTAHASTYGISVYNVNNTGGDDTLEQALPGSGSIFTSAYSLGTSSYTGAINFVENGPGDNTIGDFLSSAGGTFTNAAIPALTTTLSGGSFTVTTGLAITFTTTYDEILTISHDDGVSLYSGGVNLLPTGDSAPTTDVDSTVSIGPGSYTLYYIEANGLPADLVTSVPEPASLAILGVGLFGLGMIRRRKSTPEI